MAEPHDDVPRELGIANLERAQELDARVDRLLSEASEKAASVYDVLIEIRECDAWKALGWKTWAEYAESKVGKARRDVYRHLEAALVVKELRSYSPSPGPSEAVTNLSQEPESLPASQLRALAKAPEGSRAEVLEVASKVAGGRPTEAVVKAAVEAKIAEPDAPKERLVEATVAASKPRRRPEPIVPAPPLNPGAPAPGSPFEEASQAPTDGASLIEDVREEYEERAAKVDELPDDEWVAMQPLASKLAGNALKKFRAAALFYRDFERDMRRALGRWLTGAKKERFGRSSQSWLSFRIEQALKIGPPSSWKRCAAPQDGGCGGTGEIPMEGECPACKGRGYIER